MVLAPVAGAKLMEIVAPDRASSDRQSVGDGGKTNSSPGRARHKPLKPLRREGRVFRRACGLPCASMCARLRVLRAPGFPCALLIFGGTSFTQNSGASCREKAKSYLCRMGIASLYPSYGCLTIESEIAAASFAP